MIIVYSLFFTFHVLDVNGVRVGRFLCGLVRCHYQY